MFQKGYTPHNKGLKGYTNAGSFKKGRIPTIGELEKKSYGLKKAWLNGKMTGMKGKKHNEKWKQAMREKMSGRVASEQTKEKIKLSWTKERKEKERQRMLGNKITVGYKHTDEWKKQHKNRMLNFKHTEESKKKLSKTKLGKPQWHRKGERSPWWRGGITPLYTQIRGCPQYKLWRADVFERDKFTCQGCGVRGGYLEADHIKPFALVIQENKIKTFEQSVGCKELWDIDNGKTLCKECHKNTDTYMGRAKKFLQIIAN